MMDDAWMWGHGWSWAGWLVMCMVMLVFWAGLIAAVVAGVRYLGTANQPPAPGTRRPEDVLDDRYAAGEIDDDEYRRRRSILREHHIAH